MKRLMRIMTTYAMPRSIVICTAALLFMGCRSVPPYSGEGQISNTTAWEDNLVRMRSYTIRLPSFPLNEKSKGEFRLGDVAFFRKTHFAVTLRFPDNYDWDHFSKLPRSMKTPKYIAEYRLRDIDQLEGRLSVQVLDGGGKPLIHSDKLLRDFVWSGVGRRENGWALVELCDWQHNTAGATKGDDLKLQFSYSGDPSLTNRGYIALKLRPE